MYILSIKHITAFFCLGTQDSTSVLYVRFNHRKKWKKKVKSPKKGHKNVICSTKKISQRTPVYSMTTKTKRQNIDLCDLSWVHAYWAIYIFVALCNKSATKVPPISIWELQINFSSWVHKESAKNKNQLYCSTHRWGTWSSENLLNTTN